VGKSPCIRSTLTILLLWQLNSPGLSFRRKPESLQEQSGFCQKIPASAGMTVVCLFNCQINKYHWRSISNVRLGGKKKIKTDGVYCEILLPETTAKSGF